MEISADTFILYPIHINSSKSQRNGRKYSLPNSIKDPSYKEIRIALEGLKIEFTDEPEKRHPKELYEIGRFTIIQSKDRKDIIKEIVNYINELRENKKKNETKPKVANKLNLVPKSKKKTKK